MILETKRLILRPFADDDLEVLVALFQNEGFARFSGHKSFTREETTGILEKFLRWNASGQPSPFALIERTSGRLFGYCGFLHQEVDGVPEIEIGYRLHPDFWNRGLATEAARAVRDYAFRGLKLERVISLIVPENKASRRVAEKNGMRIEKETVFKGFPSLVFVLTRPEWVELRDEGHV